MHPPPLRVSHRKLCFTPVITIKLFTAKKIQYNTFPVYLKAHIKLPYHYEWSASLSRTCVRCQLRLNCVKGAEPLCCFPSECLRNNWDFYELEKKKKRIVSASHTDVNHKTTLSDGSVVFYSCWTHSPSPFQTINCRRRHIFNIPLTCQHILTVLRSIQMVVGPQREGGGGGEKWKCSKDTADIWAVISGIYWTWFIAG